MFRNKIFVLALLALAVTYPAATKADDSLLDSVTSAASSAWNNITTSTNSALQSVTGNSAEDSAQTAITAAANYSPDQCYFCTPLRKFVATGNAFAKKMFSATMLHAKNLLVIVTQLWLLFFVGKMIVTPRENAGAWWEFLQTAGLIILVSTFLSTADYFFYWIYDLFQKSACQFGMFLISTGGGVSTTATGQDIGGDVAAAYSGLWYNVEKAIMPLLIFVGTRCSGVAHWALVFVYGPLLAPYIFVMGIFAAFLVQAHFYFVVLSGLFPLLLVGVVFKKTRGYAVGAVRLCLSGALTIVTASIALSFTASIITDGISGYLKVSASKGALGEAPMADGGYWTIFLIGFVSIMMHLLAPRIAANISGATDSAATAAGVVAAGQFLGSKAIKGGWGGAKLGGKGLGAAGGWAMDKSGAGEALRNRFSRASSVGDE